MNKLRDCIRMLGIPASVLVLAINVLLVAMADGSIGDGLLGPVTLVVSAFLLIVVIVHAIIDFRQRKGDNGRRWIGLFQDISVALSYASLPLVALFLLSMGLGGWGVLGMLLICVLVSGLFSIMGLAFSVVSAINGRYASTSAAWSAVLTSSIFLSLTLAVFIQPVAALFLAVSGAVLLVAITLGCIAIFSGPVFTRPGGVSGVPEWETQSVVDTFPSDNGVIG